MRVSTPKQVLVIGGGAAGQMAAWAAAEQGAHVVVLEKMPQTGLKMGLTGKGRCNITNARPIDEFIAETPGNGKFLYGAYRRLSNQDLLERLHENGLLTKVERGGRVFPVSDSAQEVRSFFRTRLQRAGVTIHTSSAVQSLRRDGARYTAVTTEGNHYAADAVIIATGGASYPQTGSDGSGWRLAEQLGHHIAAPHGALIPLVTEGSTAASMQGLSLRNVELTLEVDGRRQETLRGEMLFTHFGLSGPIVLSLSGQASAALQEKRQVRMLLDVKPALSAEQLARRIQRDMDTHRRKMLGNALQDLLPQKMIVPLLEAAGVAPTRIAAELTRAERQALVAIGKEWPFPIVATRPLREAIVTAGGVCIKEVQASTMESKLCPGLYFSGEVLDIHANTGGYNLQAAFSTGFVAGSEAGRQDHESHYDSN